MVLDGHPVGRLEQDSHGATRVIAFSDTGLPRISLAFPASGTPVAPRLTRAYLAGILPDTQAAREAMAARLGASAESQFSLLREMGADCPGAIQFLSDDQMEGGAADGELMPTDDAEIAGRLRDLRAGREDWGERGEHWSLGGAQKKFALRREGGRWYRAEGAQATSHIIKPGIERFQSQALIEHVSLRTLRGLGLRVAESEFVRFDGEPAIVVTRFDRVRGEEQGELRRVHQEDLCQSTSTLPAKKYDVTAGRVATTLRTNGASEEAVLEFIRAVIANWVLAAPDAHAKNFSVFLSPTGVADLAPLYDVSTGLGYRDAGHLAMGLGGEKEIRKVTGRHLLEFAAQVGVDGEAALLSARAFASAMPWAFAAAAAEAEVEDERDRQWLIETADRLDVHCGHVLTMLERTD
jgi:serine/threonine-protein kinase HipA